MTGLFTHTLTLFNKRLPQIAPPISERGLLRRSAIVLLALVWSIDFYAQVTEVSSWSELKDAMATGGNIKLKANCTDSEKSNFSFLSVSSGKTVILDLNGFTIDRGLKNEDAKSAGYVILNQGALTITDNSSNKKGKITGGNCSDSGGGILSKGDGSSLTINAGYIDDNKAVYGGGINILSGSLTINGGIISNNTAEIGGGICQNSTNIEITITGGTITGNKGTKTDPWANGGGIYCNPSKLNIKGYITITGNTVADNDCNIYINGSSKVYVTDNLDSRTRIGIYRDRNSTYFDVTNGLGNKGNKSNFISDNSKFAVGLENGEIRLKSVITPSVNMSGWTYTGDSYSPSVSVKVGSNTIYSGYGTITYTYKASNASTFTSTAPVDAGTHQVKAFIAESSQYSSGEATSEYTISKRGITIKAKDQEFTYGGSIYSATDMVKFVNSSVLASGESLTAITLTPSTSDCTTNGTITPSAATIKRGNTDKTSNYNITYQTGKLTISKKNITIRAKEQIITYGSNISSSTAQVTFTELVTNDALTSITLTPSTSNCTTNGTISTNAATIKRGNTDKTSNYNITYASGNLIINKKALTVTAKNNTITYGDLPDNDGVSYTGFVNSETSTVLGGSLEYAYSYSQFGDVGNTYKITPSGLTSTNYDINFVHGTLTVVQKEVGLSWSTPTTYTYDGAPQAPTATATGTVNSDEIGVTVTGEQTNAGNYTATASELTGTKSGNYKLPNAKTQAFTISTRPITVTPDDGQSKTYGDADPTLTYTVDDLVANETLTGVLSRTDGSNVGNYNIKQGTVTDANNGNYSITFTTGKTFAITPKTASLGWSATAIDYDGTAQAPTASVTNLEAGDECNVTISVAGEHTAVGSYTAEATTLNNGNYALPATNTHVYEIVRPMTGIEFTASKHWNTYYAFEDLATPTGLTAYIVTGVSGTTATTSEIGYIPEGVGVLLYSASAGSDYKASAYTGAAGSFTANKLNGSTSATALDSEAGYILYGDAFVLTTGGTLPANRCYLPVNIGASTRSLTIDGGDGTTSLYKVNIEEMGDDKWFDLQGQRIERPHKKGLYIHDGKKVVIR